MRSLTHINRPSDLEEWSVTLTYPLSTTNNLTQPNQHFRLKSFRLCTIPSAVLPCAHSHPSYRFPSAADPPVSNLQSFRAPCIPSSPHSHGIIRTIPSRLRPYQRGRGLFPACHVSSGGAADGLPSNPIDHEGGPQTVRPRASPNPRPSAAGSTLW